MYVFSRDEAGTWSHDAYVKASNTQPEDAFHFVALSGDGNTLAAGAHQANGPEEGMLDTGSVYVYFRDPIAGWGPQAHIGASNLGWADHFGWRVALSEDGDTLAASSVWERSSTTGIGGNEADDSLERAGAVYIYTRYGSAWSQEAYVKASNTDYGDAFGLTLALSADGEALAVGTHLEDSSATGINGDQQNNGAHDSGAVYLY